MVGLRPTGKSRFAAPHALATLVWSPLRGSSRARYPRLVAASRLLTRSLPLARLAAAPTTHPRHPPPSPSSGGTGSSLGRYAGLRMCCAERCIRPRKLGLVHLKNGPSPQAKEPNTKDKHGRKADHGRKNGRGRLGKPRTGLGAEHETRVPVVSQPAPRLRWGQLETARTKLGAKLES